MRLNVNGVMRTVEAEPDTPLLWVIREQVGLTGTKYGCGIAQCGACTIHLDGQPARACLRRRASFSIAWMPTAPASARSRKWRISRRLAGRRAALLPKGR